MSNQPDRQNGDGLRFYIDHGVIHDRVTGKHVVTDGEWPLEDDLPRVLAFLNSLAPVDERLMPLSDINDLDDVCRELGIQDSHVTPAQAVRELNEEIERLRAVPPKPASDAMQWGLTPKEFVDTILSACDPSNWDAERHQGEKFMALKEAYQGVHEIAVEFQTAMYKWTKLYAPVPPADDTQQQRAAMMLARSGTGAAEPVAWPDHPGATVDAVAFVEGVKRYPSMDRDASDLAIADKQAACQGAFIEGFKRAIAMRSAPLVRGDREAIAKLQEIVDLDSHGRYGRLAREAIALLSLPVPPGASGHFNEREKRERIGDLPALARAMGGHKIIDGLKDAIAGNFVAVTIDGQRWIRVNTAGVGEREAIIEECAKIADSYPQRRHFGAEVVEMAAKRIAEKIRALSRQAPHSSSEGGR